MTTATLIRVIAVVALIGSAAGAASDSSGIEGIAAGGATDQDAGLDPAGLDPAGAETAGLDLGNADGPATDAGAADTLAAVRARDTLNCGVGTGIAGFASPDANGNWQGFDVAICKAIAAAVLGDASKVTYIATEAQSRFDDLAAGDVDVLARNATWSYGGDTDPAFDFVVVDYYDSQGFMVPKKLAVTSAKELDGAQICVRDGGPSARNLADWFKANGLKYQPVVIDRSAEVEQRYLSGACDAYSAPISSLAATRASFANPADHVILPEAIAKEPLSLVVRRDDGEWADIVRWTFYALLAAEEYGITSANIEEQAASSTDPEVQRLLGRSGSLGEMIGLDDLWAKRAIAASGNYGEIFNATIGEATAIKLARGLNALWTQGGLMYAPPFR